MNRDSADDTEFIPLNVGVDQDRVEEANCEVGELDRPGFDHRTKEIIFQNLAAGRGYVKESVKYLTEMCGGHVKLVNLIHWIRDEKKIEKCPAGPFIVGVPSYRQRPLLAAEVLDHRPG